MKRTYIFLLTFASVVFFLSTLVLESKRNAVVAEHLTFITTTNPIPSIPSTDIIYESMKSFYRVKELRGCKKIIVFDGIQPGYEHRKEDYEQYKKNIKALTETSPYFANTTLVFCPQWSHIAGAVKTALEQVRTPFIFLHQHDFLLQKDINVSSLVKTMRKNASIKHVRLNQWRNLPHKKTGYHYSFDGDVDSKVQGPCPIALCRTFGWSDNDHFARTDYYKDFVLPHCKFGAMEWFMDAMLKKALQDHGDTGHDLFGTYLLGDIKDGRHIRHLDGRGTTKAND